MAYSVTFPTSGPLLTPEELTEWLTAQGEPYEQEGPGAVRLRALPVLLVTASGEGCLKAHLEIAPETPLERLVQLVFALSVHAGADVQLVGRGRATRPELWMLLADEQDRLRLARALERAEEQGKREDVTQGLWRVLASTTPGRDIRWDASRQRIVELKEVGAPEGLDLDTARWHDESATEGDILPVAVQGPLHVLAWRWLSEAHPGLTDH